VYNNGYKEMIETVGGNAIMQKTFYEAASRPRGDEHVPVILEWHEPAFDYDEAVLASINILANVPQTTRKAAKEYAKTYINELIKE
jgi:hypothetical protein